MKKILLIPLFLFLSAPFLMADFVGQAEALEIAEKFFGYSSGGAAVRSQKPCRLELSWTESFQPAGLARSAAFYVFNREGGGYVIISADSGYHPVIAYSYTETFDIDKLPDGYRYVLGGLEKDVENVILSGRSISPEIGVEWKSVGLKTKGGGKVELDTPEWGQGEPYNRKCPVLGGRRCVTGCVATATAILMGYQGVKAGAPNTPADTVLPSYSFYYYDWATGNGETVNIPALDIRDHEYDFASMPVHWYDVADASEKVKDNMAELMYDLGVAYRMVYDPDGSGTLEKYVNVMGDFFRYDKNNSLIPRDACSPMEWFSRIVESIDNDNPVILAGVSEEGGHAFIIDGYDSETGFVRYNFGWNGSYHDSFFRVGYDFQEQETACFNLVPATGYSEYPPARLYYYPYGEDGGLSVSGTITKGEPFDLKVGNMCVYTTIPQNFHLRSVLVSGNVREQINTGYGGVRDLDISIADTSCRLPCIINSDLKLGDYIELEYSSDFPEDPSSVKEWLPLDGPSDGSVVASYPVIPAFFMDMPSEAEVGQAVLLKLLNGKVPWSYNTDWSWEPVTAGATAEISSPADNWNYIIFKTAGTFNVCAAVKDGEGNVIDSVVARVTVTE